MSIPQPSASFRDVYSLGKEARKTSIIFQSENWFTPFWNHWKMSPLTFYVQNTIWIFTPFYWVRLWASYIFLSPFYWVRYEANYIFLPLFIGSDMSQITFSTPFLLGQKWVKLHFLPPLYWVRSGAIYIFLQFLLEQIMWKLPLFIGSFLWFSYVVTLRKMLLQHFEKEANISHPWLLMSHGQVGVTQLTQILWTKD